MTVNVAAAPAVAGEGKPVTLKVLAAAGVTAMPVCVPAIEGLTWSAAGSAGHTFWIKGAKGDEATNTITVQASGGSTFDGGNASAVVNVADGGYGFQCDGGTTLYVLAYYAGNGVFSGGPTPCGALQTDYSVSTGCNAVAIPMLR